MMQRRQAAVRWTPGGLLAALALAGCVQPLKLARDDSPTVLSHQLLTAPNPAEPGRLRDRTLFYGSGRRRGPPECRDSAPPKPRPGDGTSLASGPTPALTRERKKYGGFGFDSLP